MPWWRAARSACSSTIPPRTSFAATGSRAARSASISRRARSATRSRATPSSATAPRSSMSARAIRTGPTTGAAITGATTRPSTSNGDGVADQPYRPNDLIDQVVWTYPLAKLLLNSPAVQTVRFAQARFPALLPGGVVDSAPLMAPPAGAGRHGERSRPDERPRLRAPVGRQALRRADRTDRGQPRGPAGRMPGAGRPQRRRQDHAHEAAARSGAAERGHGADPGCRPDLGCRRRRRGSSWASCPRPSPSTPR